MKMALFPRLIQDLELMVRVTDRRPGVKTQIRHSPQLVTAHIPNLPKIKLPIDQRNRENSGIRQAEFKNDLAFIWVASKTKKTFEFQLHLSDPFQG
jgi:hypothetical protein